MDIVKHLKDIIDNYKTTVSLENVECQYILNQISSEIDSYISETTKDNTVLTNRETEVLTLVSKGFTNKEVASALDLSSKTIEFHLKNVYTKLEVSGRSEAISYAISKGYIVP
jgi:DNA-binding NarL/FixJ family response regulator